MEQTDTSATLDYEEIRQILKRTGQLQEENAQMIRELSKQIGGLGEKFGGFTEGLALPSMTKILKERFHATVVSPRTRAWRNGEEMEVDVLAYSNSGTDEVYVVEVKSHLRQEGIRQILRTLHRFRDFFPQHKDKKLYGILAAVDAPSELQKKVLQEGLYLARIHDGVFEVQVPEDFQPREF